ncbi:retinol dehydrogenase 11-like [Vanessa cardui]|uniref:retinol dehydrogenase 11-like n=1 Tax=Vanessa cardui TaxID=171605 RepID=UPI001F148F26|nr:retinol dehydrogenase 11-like [Vanessa cardui]
MIISLMLLCAFIVICLLISSYQKKRNAMCKSKKHLNGRTAIVTGGTSGIGLEIALDFASRGAKVIIACPFNDEGIEARNRIIEKTGNRNVIFKLLDLASLNSVRQFAKDILKTEDRLDILMNNAGVGIPGDFQTDDGMGFIMQVNYYGHFLLSILLLPLLMRTGTESDKSRIVNMTSITRYIGSYDVDNYDKIRYWFKVRIYSNSKLCFVLFSRALAKRLEGCNVVVNSADPGLVGTKIYESCNVLIGFIVKHFLNIFFKNSLEGAQTALQIALDDKCGLQSGKIYENCEVVNNKFFDNIDTASEKLWERSIKLVKLENHELEFLK